MRFKESIEKSKEISHPNFIRFEMTLLLLILFFIPKKRALITSFYNSSRQFFNFGEKFNLKKQKNENKNNLGNH